MAAAAADAWATNIGGDAFGYRAGDSSLFTTISPNYNNGSLAYSSIAGTGTSFGLGGTNNSSALLSSIGFTFSFYGTGYTSLYVGTNGIVTFSTGSGTSGPQDLSAGLTGGSNQPLIAAYWDSLRFNGQAAQNAGSEIYYQLFGTPGSQVLVLEWYHVVNRNGATTGQGQGLQGDYGDFQVILVEGSNDVYLSYSDVVWGATNYDNAGNATVGVRNTNSGGTNLNFLQWHYQTAGSTPPAGYGNPVTNGTVIRVSLQPIPEPSTVALFGAGAAALAAWTLRRRRARRR